MKTLLNLLIDYWPLVGPVVYEIVARLWPTRWNVSILDNAWKLINALIPNKRIPDGSEKIVDNKDAQKMTNHVRVDTLKHILRSILIVCLFSFSANAQIWQNFKGVRLVNESDTTEQLSVEGSIYYDDDARKFYGRDQWGWKEFSLGGGGGGNISGTITSPFIPYASAANEISDSKFYYAQTSTAAVLSMSTADGADNNNVVISGGGGGGGSVARGAYTALYGNESAGATAGDLVLSSGSTGGFSLSGGTGGMITAPTGDIDISAGNELTFNVPSILIPQGGTVLSFGNAATDVFTIQSPTGAASILMDVGATLNDGAIQIGGISSAGNTSVIRIDPSNYYGFGSGIVLSSAGLGNTIKMESPEMFIGSGGAGGFAGVEYDADYSANFVNESIITKRYADTKLDGTMVANRVPFGQDANTLTTDDGFTFNGTTNTATFGTISSISIGMSGTTGVVTTATNTTALNIVGGAGLIQNGASVNINAGSGSTTFNAGHINLNAAIATGSGTDGNINLQLASTSTGAINMDVQNGNLYIFNIPTANPCGTAGAGAVWSNGGVLTICP